MMYRLKRLALLLAFVALPASAQTVEVHGVELPTRVELGGEELVLNGAGLRKKFFFQVYVGSLYLPRQSSDPQEILTMEGPKRVQMNLLRDIDQSTLAEAMTSGFQTNLTEAERQKFAEEIRQFGSLVDEGHEGDSVMIDYIPGSGIRITHAGKEMGHIANEDFYPQVLKLWIGESPADKSLKQGMLGR